MKRRSLNAFDCQFRTVHKQKILLNRNQSNSAAVYQPVYLGGCYDNGDAYR